MTTCVNLDCPFICYCKEYNYLVDRGEGCEHMEQIIKKAKRFDSQRKKRAKEAKTTDLTVVKLGKGPFRLLRCESCKSQGWWGTETPTFCNHCGKEFSALKEERGE